MRGTFRGFISFLLPILLVVAGVLDPARAQQQEKRIALVVGNGAYAKSPLATTANDAGLIAQTLQAAGFDVVGARDLDGDTLRKSFRDFIQKAQASGPGTVAMIYLAGYGIQLAGENYFIPVDSNITRDTDVPTEALRVSDYVRQLAAIPLKANIVVLDAARAQPFIEGGQPIASGLALVEPEANMLIAFNAAPGTVAPEEPGPYGIYAQSLAEMIRTGGLPLPEVFDRVRLRVNEASKGAQVPWNEQKISAQFSFFERGPDAPPPETAPDQVAAIRNKPIRDLGVQDAYAAALERDTLPAYEEFLAAYPGDPLAKRVMAIVAARREAITWRRTYRTDTPEAYWSYLRRYPRGPHAADAHRRLAILTAPAEPPPSFAMIDYDVPPPPPEEVVYVDRPVLYFSDPDFGFAPPPPPPVYYLPPPPPDFVVLPPPLPVVGLFVLPQPVFVPIPVFVRPPLYVAPPPNNIIYQNIHNTTVINTVINRPPAPPPAAAGTGAAAGPGNLAPAVAGRANPVAPAVPQAVMQRAALIQQGKAPLPPSATIQPTARPGAPPVAPANVAPTAAPSAAPQTRLPEANTLPVPGAHGGPPAPPAGAGPLPGGRPAPAATAPGATPPVHPGAPTTAAPGTTLPARPGTPTAAAPATAAPTATNPAGAPGQPPKPPVAQAPPGAGPADRAKSATRAPAGSPPPGAGAPGAPPGAAGRPVVPPPSAAHEPIRPQHLPAAPPQAARPAAPPPRPQAVARPTPPPPPRVSAPPPRVAAPPPPRPVPPVAVARPAPPPMARPAPPPMARPAPPPPPVARPAPPPPPRMAVAPPPPPRPAAPPPHPAAPAPAAKRCPPNQPKC
ncbi:caspase family protein [Bradyrhizobium liaoningense]|uniref:caspase family protein n=1 Tax=Bradyrhizobium liaoningense TaxID=43992 RepID=UPI001BA449FC|nr:caspase domain-containing protein [Bradyrhizobium liaoningense]MBR0855827.1 caspase family protein [Bradyrhizobium liaoningense]